MFEEGSHPVEADLSGSTNLRTPKLKPASDRHCSSSSAISTNFQILHRLHLSFHATTKEARGTWLCMAHVILLQYVQPG
jgi:hypothetical protein